MTATHAFQPPPPRLSAVLFDLGGTLIDYLGGASRWPAMERPGIEALHQCLTDAGYALDADLFHDAFVRALDESWQAATSGTGDPPTLLSLILDVCRAAGHHVASEVHEAAVAAYCAPIAAQSRARPGAFEVLDWLRGHGIRVGLISNSVWPANAHRLDLERHHLLSLIEYAAFSSETGLWKPDPALFRLVLQQFGCEPDRGVFVGDRLVEDIDGAHRAGMRSILVEGTQDYDHIDATAYAPDGRIRSLFDLPSVLTGLFGNS